MGLDITAHEVARITHPHEHEEDCWERGHVYAYLSDPSFDRSARGLVLNRCYKSAGETMGFRAGSYSGYSGWRSALCLAALGVTSEEFWAEDEGTRVDEPFYEIINFSDCEGTIGPEAAADLAADFAEQEKRVLAARDGDPYFAELYETWRAAFELAAGTGLVDFH